MQPSYYAFGRNLPLQSQYEIDLYITSIGKAHEAENVKEVTSNQ